jgi:hypothetical protein
MSGHSAVRLEDGMIAEEAVWSTERSATLRCIMDGLLPDKLNCETMRLQIHILGPELRRNHRPVLAKVPTQLALLC